LKSITFNERAKAVIVLRTLPAIELMEKSFWLRFSRERRRSIDCGGRLHIARENSPPWNFAVTHSS
jgi:hypothetical protein